MHSPTSATLIVMLGLAAETPQAEIVETLDSVGFNTEMRAKPIASLSGGWKMKLALARAMLWNADILLLDEPTNHLDVKNVAWLENYLTHLPTVTSIIVSHDSGFLDNVCTGGHPSARTGSALHHRACLRSVWLGSTWFAFLPTATVGLSVISWSAHKQIRGLPWLGGGLVESTGGVPDPME